MRARENIRSQESGARIGIQNIWNPEFLAHYLWAPMANEVTLIHTDGQAYWQLETGNWLLLFRNSRQLADKDEV